jgi:nucleotide-binding universal stress UspA family protein
VFAHVVVAVDGSGASQQALAQAIHIARQDSAILTGVFIVDSKWDEFIGNDWQSSERARRGFLDYVGREQQDQARAARKQFEDGTEALDKARFALREGDPTDVLLELASTPSTDLLVLSKRVFQVSGRPSLKDLASRLAKHAKRPVLLLP